MIWFVLASLFPFALAGLAVMGHGWAAYGGLAFMVAGVPLLDLLLPRRHAEPVTGRAHSLSICLALAHLTLLPAGIYALSGATGLENLEQAALFGLMLVIFGQISNSNAHELIHLPGGIGRFLGRLVYASLLFGHHATAHPAVHHRFVATPEDPNSARPGESLYRFLPRAWIGSFRAGLRIENDRMRKRGKSILRLSHPYAIYATMSLVMLAWSAALGGGAGLLTHVVLAFGATAQLLTSDYVQHYGLVRRQDDTGRYEPVSADHSWNAPDGFSRRMMLNAPLHSEHHLRPSVPYNALSAPSGPVLPYSLPIMAALATVPPVWKRVMERELSLLASARPLKPMPRSRRPRLEAAE